MHTPPQNLVCVFVFKKDSCREWHILSKPFFKKKILNKSEDFLAILLVMHMQHFVSSVKSDQMGQGGREELALRLSETEHAVSEADSKTA